MLFIENLYISLAKFETNIIDSLVWGFIALLSIYVKLNKT